MALGRAPFTPTRLQEERDQDKGRVLSIRFNEQELRLLEEQKNAFDTTVDGAAIKLCWQLGWKVLQHDLGEETLKWLSRRDRTRLNTLEEGSRG